MNEYFEVSAREQGFADWKDCQNNASKERFKIVIDRGFELHRLVIESGKREKITVSLATPEELEDLRAEISKRLPNTAQIIVPVFEDFKGIIVEHLTDDARVVVRAPVGSTKEDIEEAIRKSYTHKANIVTSEDINRRNNSEDAIREYLSREISNRFVKLDDEEMQKESNAGTYANINVEFLKAYQSAKDLGAEHGLNDPRFVAAAAKARQLSASLKEIDDKVHQRTKNSYEPPAGSKYWAAEGWIEQKANEHRRLRSEVSTIPFLMKQGTYKHILIASRLGEIINYKRIGVITQALPIAYALERDDVKPGHIQNPTLRRKLEIKLAYLKNLFK